MESGGANGEGVLLARAVRFGMCDDLDHVLRALVLGAIDVDDDLVTPDEIVRAHRVNCIQGLDQHVTRFNDRGLIPIEAVQQVGKGDPHRGAGLVVWDGEVADEATELVDVVGGLIRRGDEEEPEVGVGT